MIDEHVSLEKKETDNSPEKQKEKKNRRGSMTMDGADDGDGVGFPSMDPSLGTADYQKMTTSPIVGGNMSSRRWKDLQ